MGKTLGVWSHSVLVSVVPPLAHYMTLTKLIFLSFSFHVSEMGTTQFV